MTDSDDREDTLPAAIRRLRAARNLTQDALAEELGTTRRSVMRWENDGDVPQRRNRARLIALGIDPQLFRAAELKDEVEKRLRQVEAEIAAIRSLLG